MNQEIDNINRLINQATGSSLKHCCLEYMNSFFVCYETKFIIHNLLIKTINYICTHVHLFFPFTV